MKYVLRYRSRTPTRTLTLNPNPNPKIKKKRHRNKIQHRVISKSEFPRDGDGFIKGLVIGTGRETHMDLL